MPYKLADQRQKVLSLPAAVAEGALLRPFGLNGFFSTYYYSPACSRAVALR